MDFSIGEIVALIAMVISIAAVLIALVAVYYAKNSRDWIY
jgi:hypothetical protein